MSCVCTPLQQLWCQHSSYTKPLQGYKLNFLAENAWVAPTIGGNSEKALSKTLFEYKVQCGAGEYKPVIGTCAETGLYLNQPPYGGYSSYKRQQVNVQISCEITEPCEELDNLVGNFNGIGRAPGGIWKGLYPITMNLVGGTGDFAHIVSGTWTFKDEGAFAELKFLYWKKEKVEQEEKKEKEYYKDSKDEGY